MDLKLVMNDNSICGCDGNWSTLLTQTEQSVGSNPTIRIMPMWWNADTVVSNAAAFGREGSNPSIGTILAPPTPWDSYKVLWLNRERFHSGSTPRWSIFRRVSRWSWNSLGKRVGVKSSRFNPDSLL